MPIFHLGKFFPGYFILFIAVVNGIIFLNSVLFNFKIKSLLNKCLSEIKPGSIYTKILIQITSGKSRSKNEGRNHLTSCFGYFSFFKVLLCNKKKCGAHGWLSCLQLRLWSLSPRIEPSVRIPAQWGVYFSLALCPSPLLMLFLLLGLSLSVLSK